MWKEKDSPVITPEEGKADKSWKPLFGTVSSVQHRGSDSVQSYCLNRIVVTCKFREFHHQTREEEQKTVL